MGTLQEFEIKFSVHLKLVKLITAVEKLLKVINSRKNK